MLYRPDRPLDDAQCERKDGQKDGQLCDSGHNGFSTSGPSGHSAHIFHGAPTGFQPRPHPKCRSALRFGRRRPSFWRCVLSLLCRRGSPIPARPASHFCRPLEGFELAFLGHPELVHRAAALSTVASPSTELRGSNAWSLPGRTLPSERPPPPSRRRDGRIVAGSAGAGWQRGRVGRAVGLPALDKWRDWAHSA